MSTPRTRTGCKICRERHLKCDEARPTCGRCQRSGNECIRSFNIRFRHSSNPSFSKAAGPGKCDYDFDQAVWLRTSGNLSFIDETQELISIYETESDVEGRPERQASPGSWDQSSFSADLPSAQSFLQGPGHTLSPSLSDIGASLNSLTQLGKSLTSPIQFPGSVQSPTDQQNVFSSSPHLSHQQSPFPSHLSGVGLDITPGNSNNFDSIGQDDSVDLTRSYSLASSGVSATSQIYLDHSAWPLRGVQQATLLRHFVENLSCWFDLCDQDRHFELIVPQRAATCPTLLNAILAMSARHLSRVSDFDPYASNRYHDECLKHLIPMLDDSAAVLDETLLAATIVLRCLEELDVPLAGTDTQGHLIGTQAFFRAQERAGISSPLQQAAYWVGLRQEIYMSLVNQRTIQTNLDHCNIDLSFDMADDCTWANRVVVFCAKVLKYCFGDEEKSVARWEELKEHGQQWQDFRPASFIPVYYRDADYNKGEAFPEIWFLSAPHAIGVQHYNMTQILLAVYNPKIPRLGPSQRQALILMEEEIKTNIRSLCGIALSNRASPPAMFTACMGITMCGDRFTDRLDQEALLDILVRTERDHAWPTATAQRHLKEAWNWMDGDDGGEIMEV